MFVGVLTTACGFLFWDLQLSDIGHCCIPLDSHKIWLQLLEEEMFQQASVAGLSHRLSGCLGQLEEI